MSWPLSKMDHGPTKGKVSVYNPRHPLSVSLSLFIRRRSLKRRIKPGYIGNSEKLIKSWLAGTKAGASSAGGSLKCSWSPSRPLWEVKWGENQPPGSTSLTSPHLLSFWSRSATFFFSVLFSYCPPDHKHFPPPFTKRIRSVFYCFVATINTLVNSVRKFAQTSRDTFIRKTFRRVVFDCTGRYCRYRGECLWRVGNSECRCEWRCQWHRESMWNFWMTSACVWWCALVWLGEELTGHRSEIEGWLYESLCRGVKFVIMKSE